MAYKHMPVDLVLVRHGESEGNLAQSRAKLGDDAAWRQQAFRDRHNSQYRLTDTGREQARAAGSWVKEHLGEQFDRFYTSEYVRALETAALLGMDGGKWNTQHFLRERDRGVLSNKSHAERRRWHAEEVERQMRDPFYYQPPGGESIANVCIRVESVINTIQRECSGLRCLVVCHGGIIKAFRALLEREQRPLSPVRSSASQPSLSAAQQDFRKTELSDELEASIYPNYRDPKKIYNGQVVHYTRRNPVTGEVHSKLQWVRSICPWRDTSEFSAFEGFCAVRYSNDELLSRVRLIPQLVNGPANLAADELNFHCNSRSHSSVLWAKTAVDALSYPESDSLSSITATANPLEPTAKICGSGDDDVCHDTCVICGSSKANRSRNRVDICASHHIDLPVGNDALEEITPVRRLVDTDGDDEVSQASPVSPDLTWD